MGIFGWKDEFKIFIFFLLVYFIFSTWHGWNEETKLYVGIRIAENNSFSLGEYSKFTGDRILYNGTIYGDKAPAIPCLISVVDFVFNHFIKYDTGLSKHIMIPHKQFKTVVYSFLDPSFKLRLLRIVSNILFSSIFGSLIVLLIYKSAFILTKDKKISYIVAFVFGLGTFLLPYSTTIYGSAAIAFFFMLIYYMFFVLEHIKPNTIFLIGLTMGLSVFFDFSAAIYLLPFVILIFIYLPKKVINIVFLATGFIIGILPLISYNYSIFGKPFIPYSMKYADPRISPCAYGKKYYSGCPTFNDISFKELILRTIAFRGINFINLTFGPYRGLFVFSPVLLISFMFLFNKEVRRISKEIIMKSIIIITLVSILFISSYGYWYGGNSFGSKYELGLVPLLSVTFSYAVLAMKKDHLFKFFLVFLFLVSLLIMLSSFSTFWEGYIYYYKNDLVYRVLNWYNNTIVIKYPVDLRGYKIVMLSPILGHYFKAFLDWGPRSRILEDLSNGIFPPDIYTIKPENNEYFDYFYSYNKHLPIISILTLFVIIFHREIMVYSRKKYGDKRLFYIVLLSIILYFAATTIYFSGKNKIKGVYPEGDGYWVKSSFVYEIDRNDIDKPSYYLFSFYVRNYFDNEKNITIEVNDRKITTIKSFISDEIVQLPIKLYPGKNIIKIKTDSPCRIPALIENVSDYRCLNFFIHNISLVRYKPVTSIDFVPSYGFDRDIINLYTNEYYLRKSSSFIVFNNLSYDREIKLSIYLKALIPLHLRIFHDGNEKVSIYLNKNEIYNDEVTLNLHPGRNELNFAFGDCTPISENDSRCFSAILSKIDISERTQPDIEFSGEFYNKLPTDDVRWIKNVGSVEITNYGKIKKGLIKVVAQSYHYTRTLDVVINDKLYGKITFYKEARVYYFPIVLKSGINKIQFISTSCDVPKDLEGSDDTRCLSIGIKNITVIDLSSLNKTEFFLSGFYEKAPNEDVVWMSKTSKLLLYNPTDTEKKYIISMVARSYMYSSSFKIGNSSKISEFAVHPQNTVISFFIDLKPGMNIVDLSVPTCHSPIDVEGISDTRCLGIGIKNITLIDLSSINRTVFFFDEFYEKAPNEDVVWMSKTSKLLLYNPTDTEKKYIISMVARSYMYKLSLSVSKSTYGNDIIVKPQNTVVSFDVVLEPGMNVINIYTDDCYSPHIVERISDTRCLSIGIKNITVIDLSSLNKTEFFLSGFYEKAPNEDVVWMSKTASIIMFDPITERKRIYIYFKPYYNKRSVNFYFDSRMTNKFDISLSGGWVYTPVINITKGLHELKIVSLNNCLSPNEINHNSDYRCLSVGIGGVKIDD